MYHITDSNLYHTGQYDRLDRKYLDAVYIETMTYHVVHFSKTSLGTFESDAKACFDRMVMEFFLLFSSNRGVIVSC